MNKSVASGGSWLSPVTAKLVAQKSLRFGSLGLHDGFVYWTEARPGEDGRSVLVKWSSDEGYLDLNPPPFSVRSRVHEYGGGEFHAGRLGIFFVNDEDQDVYRADHAGGRPERITEVPGARFADFDEDVSRRRLICVCEDHGQGQDQPVNTLVAIDIAAPGGAVTTLHEGYDFYAFARLDRAGQRLAFLAWNLPHMPWQAAELLVCDMDLDGALGTCRKLAGGKGQAAFQPCWSEAGDLFFVAEVDDESALYVWDGAATRRVTDIEGEFSRPLWGLSATSYALLDGERLAATFVSGGAINAAVIDLGTAPARTLFAGFAGIDNPVSGNGALAAYVTGDTQATAIGVLADAAGQPENMRIIRNSASLKLDAEDISIGRPVSFPGAGGIIVHGLYYPPANSSYSLCEGEAPPAIVTAHGGPTGMAGRGLKLKTQYWTSRGFAVLDVDYRGSTGYGRAYREALWGKWGLADVEDVASGARWLADQGLADAARLIISGSSAGGYTVLQALVQYDLFAAGAAYYGISDLAKLAAHTHKFEAGYIYDLVGAKPGQADKVFAQRSPIFSAQRITTPVIFLQGSADKVVPPGQSRDMANILKAGNVPVAYVEFEGEGHGFRRPQNVRRALELEYAFYNTILDLGAEEILPAVEIANMA